MRETPVRGDCLQKREKELLIGGIIALMIAMGIGRFAYTPILPAMQAKLQFNETVAGLLASSNYAGYLVGAIVTSVVSFKEKRYAYLVLFIIVSVVTTFMMGLTQAYPVFYMLRFISGVASAFIFVLASSIVLDMLAQVSKSYLSGLFYAGVGGGIAVSAVVIPYFQVENNWQLSWMSIGIVSLILAFIAIYLMRDRGKLQQVTKSEQVEIIHVPAKKWFPFLVTSYGLEGFGYIITGTFIVAMAERSVHFQGDAITVWLIAGLAAIPSCIIWSQLAKSYGYMKVLTFILFLQGIGIVLPALYDLKILFYISSFLFGATFMGITTLTTTVARRMFPIDSSKILGFLTVIYALGQMIGPALAGYMMTYTNSYSSALVMAAASIIIAGLCVMTGIKYDQNKESV